MDTKRATPIPQHRGIRKVDADLTYLMKNLYAVMKASGDGELVPFLPWSGDKAPAGELSDARLVQAYSIAFQLLNMVEENTANQIRRNHERRGGLDAWRGLWSDQLRRLRNAGSSPEDIAKGLGQVLVEPVLTAHPTESKRITVLQLHRELYLALVQRENTMWTPSEHADLDRHIRALLERLWRTGEIYLKKPSVEMEREGIVYYLTRIFPAAVANLSKRLDRAWAHAGFDPALLEGRRPNIRFSTWVGGDRDGHPLVTPAVTEQTLLSFRVQALRMHRSMLEELRAHLSLSDSLQPVPPCLKDRIAAYWELLGNEAAVLAERNPGEPWRQFLSLIMARLPLRPEATSDDNALSTNFFTSYRYAHELVADLRILRDSLLAVGAAHIVADEIDPAIQSVEVFGFHLASLDIRQNSGFHERAIAQILNACGEANTDFAAWTEDERLECLDRHLQSSRRRLAANRPLGPEAQACLGALAIVGRHCRRYGYHAIGALILSMTRRPSDLLAVYVLARESGLLESDEHGRPICPIPVVPLLETVEDLEDGPDILRTFLEHPMTQRSHAWLNAQHRRSESVQQVMIGYSDSNKDKGIFASQWALHEAQARITAIGQETHTRMRFFHGRGGTISRGAGPTDRFLEALPDGALRGDLRVTEQGETIAQKYGNLLTATYNLELLQAGACRFTLPRHRDEAGAALNPVLQRVAALSADAYAGLLHTEGFIDFFRQATPIDALEQSRIGSRPSRRTGTATLDDLRAIPWVFSWSQGRFFLPGWYGVGSALEHLRKENPDAFGQLRAAAPTHPFLTYVLTNVEASVSSVDFEVMAAYADLVGSDVLRRRFMSLIETEFHLVKALLTGVFGAPLEQRRPNFSNTVERRGRALKPLHLHQINLLRQWRAADSNDTSKQDLLEALLLTVNAIAGGLKTTG